MSAGHAAITLALAATATIAVAAAIEYVVEARNPYRALINLVATCVGIALFAWCGAIVVVRAW